MYGDDGAPDGELVAVLEAPGPPAVPLDSAPPRVRLLVHECRAQTLQFQRGLHSDPNQVRAQLSLVGRLGPWIMAIAWGA
eukprot:7821807-Pyramimonas_sp.AAC.1